MLTDYLNKVIYGDCLEVVQRIPDKSINLIIADPPYNIGKAEWDKIDNYLDWCGEWIKQCERVLADNGSLYIFHSEFRSMAKIDNWIENKTNFMLKQLVVWDKWHNKFGKGNNLQGAFWKIVNNPALRNYPQMAEYILFYTFQDETGLKQVYDNRDCFRGIKEYFWNEKEKAGLKTCKEINRIIGSTLKGGGMATHYFNLEHTQWCLPTAEMYAKLQTTGYFQRPYEELRQEYEELRYTFKPYGQTSIWSFPIANLEERQEHPTQKPLQLVENIIKHSSNEDGIVLDPFLGSGTTAVACHNLDRQYIGIDISETYCKLAEKRIAAAMPQQTELDFAAGG